MVSSALLFFIVVALIGGALLVLINRPRTPARRPAPAPSSTEPTGDLVQQLLAGGTLSAVERRVWLDQLLAAQQDEEQK